MMIWVDRHSVISHTSSMRTRIESESTTTQGPCNKECFSPVWDFFFFFLELRTKFWRVPGIPNHLNQTWKWLNMATCSQIAVDYKWKIFLMAEWFDFHGQKHFWLNRGRRLGVPIVMQQKWIQLETMSLWVQSLALLSGLRIHIAMSCGVGCRCSSDLALLWLWHSPVATALIRLDP